MHRDLNRTISCCARWQSRADDFGVAKHFAILITETAHDEFVGTPYYLSPEQAMVAAWTSAATCTVLGIVFLRVAHRRQAVSREQCRGILNLHDNGPVPLLKPPHTICNRCSPV